MSSRGTVVAKNVFNTSVTSDNLSRHELLNWVNETLECQLTKIEELGAGDAYCQMNHLLFPTTINMKKVKLGSKLETDHLHNFKLFQDSMSAVGIQKPIPVERLIKQRFQDNFEFMQWYKKFFDGNSSGYDDYDAVKARNGQHMGGGAKKPGKLPIKKKQTPRPTQNKGRKGDEELLSPRDGRQHSTLSGGEVDDSVVEEMQQLTIKRLQKQNADNKRTTEALQSDVRGLEKERDFYFGKLRAAEELCQDEQDNGGKHRSFASRILEILYATEDGFEVPGQNE